MPRSELNLQSAESLGEMAYEISSYSYHLQTVINQQLAKADKCKSEIEKLISPVIDNYRDIYNGEQKWLAAIYDNEHAKSFRNIEVNSRGVATRLSYLTGKLEQMGRCLLELQNTKRRQNA